MKDLSILIPARNEMFLNRTIQDILVHIRADTEIIVVSDGGYPLEPVIDNGRVHLVTCFEAIGQRAATNLAARISNAKYIMKCDAHCAFGKAFDKTLIKTIQEDWTVVPRMYNLHAFDWVCKKCGKRIYQGPKPDKCPDCNDSKFEMSIVWKPRKSRRSDYMRFDKQFKFQYWASYEKQHPEEAKNKISDCMGCLGACFMMSRDRYWQLGGLDEAHGSWGQLGTEIACKSWLSGGRLVVNKNTWFSHMFRTNNKGFSFPYPITGKQVEKARKYSINMWKKNKWPKAKKPLSWLLDHFKPIPEWHDEV
jgi:glycosyltransferase involved in cell wall biosynthesis